MTPTKAHLNDPSVIDVMLTSARDREDMAARQRAEAAQLNDQASDLVRRIKATEEELAAMKSTCDEAIRARNANIASAKTNEDSAADYRTVVAVTCAAAGISIPEEPPAVRIIDQGEAPDAGPPAPAEDEKPGQLVATGPQATQQLPAGT